MLKMDIFIRELTNKYESKALVVQRIIVKE